MRGYYRPAEPFPAERYPCKVCGAPEGASCRQWNRTPGYWFVCAPHAGRGGDL